MLRPLEQVPKRSNEVAPDDPDRRIATRHVDAFPLSPNIACAAPTVRTVGRSCPSPRSRVLSCGADALRAACPQPRRYGSTQATARRST